MEKRPALMKQLFAVARPLGLDKDALRALFRVESLTLVPTRDIEAWIVRHNRPIPGEPHQGGKRRKASYDKRGYLRKLIDDMLADGWTAEEIDSRVLIPRGVNLSVSIVPAGAISKAIAQLWSMRHNGNPKRGIAPIADTRKRVGQVSNLSSVERVSNPPVTEAQ